jgi:hypothetical protein
MERIMSDSDSDLSPDSLANILIISGRRCGKYTTMQELAKMVPVDQISHKSDFMGTLVRNFIQTKSEETGESFETVAKQLVEAGKINPVLLYKATGIAAGNAAFISQESTSPAHGDLLKLYKEYADKCGDTSTIPLEVELKEEFVFTKAMADEMKTLADNPVIFYTAAHGNAFTEQETKLMNSLLDKGADFRIVDTGNVHGFETDKNPLHKLAVRPPWSTLYFDIPDPVQPEVYLKQPDYEKHRPKFNGKRK